jgi:hypothetical protein
LASKALRISRSLMYHLIQKYNLKKYAFAPPMEDQLKLGSPRLKPNRPAGRKESGVKSGSMTPIEG